jgi:hypothetical protein
MPLPMPVQLPVMPPLLRVMPLLLPVMPLLLRVMPLLLPVMPLMLQPKKPHRRSNRSLQLARSAGWTAWKHRDLPPAVLFSGIRNADHHP